MAGIYILSHNITCPLGNTTEETFNKLTEGISGVQEQKRDEIDDNPFWASLFSRKQKESLSAGIRDAAQYTLIEKLLIFSIQQALLNTDIDITAKETVLIFSTTKGNISLIENEKASVELEKRVNLFHSASLVSLYFHHPNKPIVISNACISGAAAILFAKRMLETERYLTAIVAGADIITKFIFSGFQSFFALSPERCHPFSANRDGINLGEAAATFILTKKPAPGNSKQVRLVSGAVTNDANHISGPSRTGLELSMAINTALTNAGLKGDHLDFISAHGTATPFNDEMEAKAFNLSGLQNIPVNSLKGYFGHTLGVSSIIESIISVQSLRERVIIPTTGYNEPTVTPVVNVCCENIYKEMNACIKTASGFGGCNVALVFAKN